MAYLLGPKIRPVEGRGRIRKQSQSWQTRTVALRLRSSETSKRDVMNQDHPLYWHFPNDLQSSACPRIFGISRGNQYGMVTGW